MKISEIITGAEPLRLVGQGKNLGCIGWFAGYLMVTFRGRGTVYIYGPNVAEAELAKIASNPYPDALFTKLKKKHGWQCKKVE